MKYLRFSIIMLLVVVLALPAFAQRRKKGGNISADALLSSSRIELLANPPRYDEAMNQCRLVLENHGPIPEAYYQIGTIYGEYVTKEYDLNKKLELTRSMILHFDSLVINCDNKDIKKKYRNKCKDFLPQVDSRKEYLWGINFNSAVELIGRLDDEYIPGYKNAVDSVEKTEANTLMLAASDSCRLHFEIAFTIDKANYKSVEGVGIVYDRLKKYDSSAIWFQKAYEIDPENLDVIQNIAYAYIQDRNWEKSIKWFKKFIEKGIEDVSVMSNIAVCFNNLKLYDSAYVYNMKTIEVDSTSGGAHFDVAQYWLLKSQEGSDSVTFYQKENNSDKAGEWISTKDNYLDSSAHYFKNNLIYEPENTLALEQYGVVSMVSGNFESGLEVFAKLAELEPHIKDHWRNKGDCQIQLGKFCKAVESFEKYVEQDPGNIKVWETLTDLYTSCDQPDKAKDAEAKTNELKNL